MTTTTPDVLDALDFDHQVPCDFDPGQEARFRWVIQCPKCGDRQGRLVCDTCDRKFISDLPLVARCRACETFAFFRQFVAERRPI